MVKISTLEVAVGILLFIVANLLAFACHYGKFGVFLFLGLFLVFKGAFRIANKRELLSLKNFLKVYLAFFLFGVITDLILGIKLTHLWSYPGYTLVNYLILYIISYPAFGFVMIYSFSLIESFFCGKIRERRIDYKHSLIFSRLLIVLGLVGMLFSLIFVNYSKGFFAYTLGAFLFIGLIDFITLKIKKSNLLERFLVKSTKYAILIILVSITQGILQELPNVFAKEWIYQNFPFNDITFLGIPVAVLFFGWVFLLIVPYVIFELVLALNRIKSLNGLEKKLIKRGEK